MADPYQEILDMIRDPQRCRDTIHKIVATGGSYLADQRVGTMSAALFVVVDELMTKVDQLTKESKTP